MKILALDISKSSTGGAIGDGSGPPRTFRGSFSGAPTRGHVGEAFREWLSDLVVIEKPDLLVFEAPLVNFGGARSPEVPRLMLGLSMVTEMICARRSIRCEQVMVQSWRKSFCGTGRPHNPKVATMAMCRSLGWEIGGSDDRADAAGVWAHAHITWGNRRGVVKMLSEATVQGLAG